MAVNQHRSTDLHVVEKNNDPIMWVSWTTHSFKSLLRRPLQDCLSLLCVCVCVYSIVKNLLGLQQTVSVAFTCLFCNLNIDLRVGGLPKEARQELKLAKVTVQQV